MSFLQRVIFTIGKHKSLFCRNREQGDCLGEYSALLPMNLRAEDLVLGSGATGV